MGFGARRNFVVLNIYFKINDNLSRWNYVDGDELIIMHLDVSIAVELLKASSQLKASELYLGISV